MSIPIRVLTITGKVLKPLSALLKVSNLYVLRKRLLTVLELGMSGENSSIDDVAASSFTCSGIIDVCSVALSGVRDTTETPRSTSFSLPVLSMDLGVLRDPLYLCRMSFECFTMPYRVHTASSFWSLFTASIEAAPAKPLKPPNSYSWSGEDDRSAFASSRADLEASALTLTIYFPGIAVVPRGAVKRGAASAVGKRAKRRDRVYILENEEV
jgi:hypothetical protein